MIEACINMIDKFVFDVFLSYSSIDKNKIYPLAQRLKKDGLHVWLDEWEISPGDMIGLKIQQGLENSRTLLLCMTPAYFNSEWSKLEHYSLIYRDPANSKRRFIPILISRLRSSQYYCSIRIYRSKDIF